MSINKLTSIIKDENTKKLIASIYDIHLPYLIKGIIDMLSDDSPMYNIISDDNKRALCNLVSRYFDRCFFLYTDCEDLDKTLKYAKMEIYKVYGTDGLRFATANEVANGVRGLIPNYVYPAGQDIYEMMCLLQWSFYGKHYYFRQAGYTLNYNQDGTVSDTLYEMIIMSAKKLNELFLFADDTERFNKAIKIINKVKRSKGYKYANYAKDEIEETITIKQLTYNICRAFPKNSSNKDYRKALALSIKANKGVKLTPYEISYLRDVYYKHAIDPDSKNNLLGECDEELKEICEKVLSEQYSGKISQNHFAYRIIGTLKQSNYTKCSEKQYNIIKEAYDIIADKDAKNEKVKENIVSDIITDDDIDMSLSSLSSAVGNGLFD